MGLDHNSALAPGRNNDRGQPDPLKRSRFGGLGISGVLFYQPRVGLDKDALSQPLLAARTAGELARVDADPVVDDPCSQVLSQVIVALSPLGPLLYCQANLVRDVFRVWHRDRVEYLGYQVEDGLRLACHDVFPRF